MQQMNTTPFTVEESGFPARARRTIPFRKSGGRKPAKKKTEKMSTQLLVKIGICAAACALILGMKALNIPGTEPVLSGVKTALNEESDLDETLGKLKFVELPDTLDVFSSGDSKLAVPVNAPDAYVEPAAQYVVWENAPDAVVKASADGEVRAVGVDSVLGNYVRLSHKDDLETIYYGLETINVEEGQPVRKYDTLGSLGKTGRLSMSVLLSGKPQPPDSYLDVVLQG